MTALIRDCPFATKKAIYRTKAAAWRDIRGDMGRPPPEGYALHPFKCQCGGWHVSSMEFVALRQDRGGRIWTVFTKEGRVGLHLRYEVKSGRQAEPVNTRYVEARTQADAAKAIGDTRPFVYVAAPDGTMPLLVIRSDEIEAVIAAYLEEWTE